MALTKIPFRPGFNKQLTDTQNENNWVDGDNVRFRYGQPEKIGGWIQTNSKTLIGVGRAQHSWVDLDGHQYAVIGTNRCLYAYYSEDFYDITPIDPDRQQTGADISTTNGSNIVTITTTATHNLNPEDLITFENAGSFGANTGFNAASFNDVVFEIKTVPSATTFTIQMSAVESGSGVTNDGTLDPLPYIEIGPLNQTLGYGWGAGTWNIGTWGTTRTSSNTSLDPGLWSLDNYGQILVATVRNGRSFQWNPLAVTSVALQTRAIPIPSNPTKSIMTIVSDRDRHLFHLGTETTVGNAATQDKMFIRFCDQENISDYQPTSVNTAGTFQLDSGSEIRGAVQGKDFTFVGTDTSAYVMQFVGPPFTFSVRQVGANCGIIGQNSMVFVDATVFWLSDEGGFFMYDGSVKRMPCPVEDFVFKTTGGNPGINQAAGQQVYASHNSLYNEIIWFYPDHSSQFVNRMVTYNYLDGTWVTGTLARNSYLDQVVFEKPYATKFEQNTAPSFPTVSGISSSQGRSIYYEHETGVNEVDASGNKTAIAAFIESGDFDLDQDGDGEFFIKIRRIIPDFKDLQGNAVVTIQLRDFPADTATSSPLGPFTITSSTDKIDTRARARLAALKISNSAVDESWRLGLFRFDFQPDGRR